MPSTLCIDGIDSMSVNTQETRRKPNYPLLGQDDEERARGGAKEIRRGVFYDEKFRSWGGRED